MDPSFETLKRKYQRMPWIIRRFLSPVSWMYHFVKTVYTLFRPCAWLIQSRANENNDPVGLMFCGNFLDKNYMVRVAFRGRLFSNRVWESLDLADQEAH